MLHLFVCIYIYIYIYIILYSYLIPLYISIKAREWIIIIILRNARLGGLYYSEIAAVVRSIVDVN